MTQPENPPADRYGVIFTSTTHGELAQTGAPFTTAQEAIEWAAKHLGRTVEGARLVEGEAGVVLDDLVDEDDAASVIIDGASIDRSSVDEFGTHLEQLDYVATVRRRAAAGAAA